MTLKKGSWLKAIAIVAVAVMLVGMGLFGGFGQNVLNSNHFKVEGVLSATGAESVEPGTQLTDGFMYQGRLTDASGNPVPDDNYSMTFKLYSAATGGTPYSTLNFTKSVAVKNGLFSQMLDFPSDYFTGETRYLGIKVGSDPEMTPRQQIYAVPYAYSLKPGAFVEGSNAVFDHANRRWIYLPVFKVQNTAKGNAAIYGYSSSATGATYGVLGKSDSASGYGGYFTNTAPGGTAIRADSPSNGVAILGKSDTAIYGYSSSSSVYGGVFTNIASGGTAIRANGPSGGVAVKATGTGVIQSSAKSYIWVPGTALKKVYGDSSNLSVFYTEYGAAYFQCSTTGTEYVITSITVPSVLYGQNVKVTKATVYYNCTNNVGSYITSTYIRCMTSAGFSYILGSSNTHHSSLSYSSYSVSATAHNVLNSDYGAVNVTLGLCFTNTTDEIVIGGVRLELEHD